MIKRPIITCGAVAWLSKASQTSVGLQLSKLQRLACICASGAMRTCPTAALEVMLEFTTLHMVYQTDSYIDFAPNDSKRSWQREGNLVPANEGLKWWNTLFPKDSISKMVNFTKKFKVEVECFHARSTAKGKHKQVVHRRLENVGGNWCRSCRTTYQTLRTYGKFFHLFYEPVYRNKSATKVSSYSAKVNRHLKRSLLMILNPYCWAAKCILSGCPVTRV